MEAIDGDSSVARVTLELWLQREGQLVFHEEFASTQPILNGGPDAAVLALSEGLGRVVSGVVERMRALNLFAMAHAQSKGAQLAQPQR